MKMLKKLIRLFNKKGSSQEQRKGMFDKDKPYEIITGEIKEEKIYLLYQDKAIKNMITSKGSLVRYLKTKGVPDKEVFNVLITL